MGGRGAGSGLRKETSSSAMRKRLSDRHINVSDKFFAENVNEKARNNYLEGLDEISKDFDIFKVSQLSVDAEKMNDNVVGVSKKGKGLFLNEDYLTGQKTYKKGDGSLSWHSAHEYAHQIQDRIIERATVKGEYKDGRQALSDRNHGTVTIKKIMLDANKKANKIEGTNKTVYDRLQGISDYANPKNKWAHSDWREAHSEAIGKFIQGHKNSSDVFGRLVYEGTLSKYNE